MLTLDQRRALLYAAAAQKLDPTEAGNWLLRSVDQAFSGVSRVVALGGQPTVTALRTTTTLVTADTAGNLKVWDPNSGRMLAVARSHVPIVSLAGSASPYLIASVDAAGIIALWDLEEPRHPRELSLHDGRLAGGRLIALGFASRSTRLLALTSTGMLYVFDVLRRRLTALRSLQAARGSLPWRAQHGALDITAASIMSEPFSSKTTLLVATTHDAVARIDFEHWSGYAAMPSSEIAGRVLSVREYSTVQGGILLGTSLGTTVWNPKTHVADTRRTGPNVGLAVHETVLLAANGQGVASENLTDVETTGASLSKYAGRPASALIDGPGGPIEIDRDGSISLLEPAETGMNIRTSEDESNIITSFGPEGNLLESQGTDANHVESLVAIRPDASPSDTAPNHLVRSYSPSGDWWPQDGEPRGLFLDSAELTPRYVLAGGQDPTGTAVVLVWDTKTGRPLRRLTLTVGGSIDGEGGPMTQTPTLVSQVTFLPKRHLIAAYSVLQELIVLWSTDNWQRVGTIDVGPIGSFAVSPDETTLMVDSLSDELSGTHAGNANTRLLFVDLASAKTRRVVTSAGTELAMYSPAGSILELHKYNVLRQMSSDAHHEIARPITIETSGKVQSVAFKPNSNVVAVSAGSSGGVKTVNLTTGAVSEPLPVTLGGTNRREFQSKWGVFGGK